MERCLMFIIVVLLIYSQRMVQGCPSRCSCHQDSSRSQSSELVVNCSGRGLRKIPKSIPPVTTVLLLSHNKLTEVPHEIFSPLNELRMLDLSKNCISTLYNSSFHGLGKLTNLNLYFNRLLPNPQTYPADVFRPLVSLTTLKMNNNVKYSPRHTRESLKLGKMPSSDFRSPAATVNSNNLLFAPRMDRVSMARDGKSGAQDNVRGSSIRSAGRESCGTRSFSSTDHTKNLDYPDQALSHLYNLTSLSIDGLPGKTLGPGFTSLTRLTNLRMSGIRSQGFCNLTSLNKNTFANVPSVRYLNLSDCLITNLTLDAFSSLKVLETLDLSFNQALGFDLLGDAFFGLSDTRLQSLYINAIFPSRHQSTTITTEQLRFFGNLSYLENLQAQFNRIRGFDNKALCTGMPPRLSFINVNGNLFELDSYVNDIGCLGALKRLDLNGFDGSWIPPLRPPDQNQLLNEHYKRPYEHSEIAKGKNLQSPINGQTAETSRCIGKQFSVPPLLETLRAADFGLLYNLKRVKVNPNNHLKHIDMSQNHFPSLEGLLCGFENLTDLILVETMTELADQQFFESFPSLENLNLSRNNLGDTFKNNTDGKLLCGLKNLKRLDISFNNIGQFPEKTLIPLENLEELDVSVNGIGTFTFDLSRMTKLRHLDISRNLMHTIPQAARTELDRLAETHNVTVNMTYNPISCTCENIDFLKWIQDSKVYFGTHRNYYCQFAGGYEKFMIDITGVINELDRTCGSYVGVFVAASAGCLVMVVFLLVGLAYRFRWKLRYLYYVTRLSLQRRNQQEVQQEFHYDAFVSFATKDKNFVNGEMKRWLEGEHELKLCIHTRDFMPGQFITSSIVDSVHRSRRTLVVLTRALLESDWCHYELQMALMEAAHTGRDVLLFLLYEHVPTHEMSREVLANLQTTSYLEFPHGEQDKSLFWRRLAQALRS